MNALTLIDQLPVLPIVIPLLVGVMLGARGFVLFVGLNLPVELSFTTSLFRQPLHLLFLAFDLVQSRSLVGKAFTFPCPVGPYGA